MVYHSVGELQDIKGLLNIIIEVLRLKEYLELMFLSVVGKAFQHVLRASCKDVWLLSLLARAVYNLEVKFAKELSLSGLPTVQLLSRYKVFKVTVVGIDFNWILWVGTGQF